MPLDLGKQKEATKLGNIKTEDENKTLIIKSLLEILSQITNAL